MTAWPEAGQGGPARERAAGGTGELTHQRPAANRGRDATDWRGATHPAPNEARAGRLVGRRRSCLVPRSWLPPVASSTSTPRSLRDLRSSRACGDEHDRRDRQVLRHLEAGPGEGLRGAHRRAEEARHCRVVLFRQVVWPHREQVDLHRRREGGGTFTQSHIPTTTAALLYPSNPATPVNIGFTAISGTITIGEKAGSFSYKITWSNQPGSIGATTIGSGLATGSWSCPMVETI